MKFEDLLDKLENVRRTGNQWSARCPAHDDARNSLSVTQGDNGAILLHCHAGCSYDDIVDALGLRKRDLSPVRTKRQSSKSQNTTTRKLVATYSYVDEEGHLLYQVQRFDPKSFTQRRPVPGGDWAYKLDGVRRVLHRLPAILEAVKQDAVVFIVEGEKDCDRLAAEGLEATTNSGGARKWQDEFNTTLTGARVALVPDNDEPGRAHAEMVAGSLCNKAASVKVLKLPDLPDKGDVSDFLDKGGTVRDLLEIYKTAPEWEPRRKNDTEGNELRSLVNLTDIGNAERFVDMHGEDIRYCFDAGRWLIWQGNRWSFDDSGEVIRRAKETALAMCELTGADNPEVSTEEAKWARQSSSVPRLNAMVNLSQSDPRILVPMKALDTDPWALNTLSGTVDLTTGELRKHQRTDLITKLAPVSYDPNATSTVLDDFLHRVLPDSELRRFVQRAAGYSLTGSVAEEKLFFAYGPPASGKTTLLESLASVMGDYAVSASFKTFAKNDSSGSAASSDVARLAGKRLVKTSEIEKGDAFSEAMVKQVTGGDEITARFLYKDFFDFKPQFKLWMAGNDRPRARDDDAGLWRRVCLLPFEQSIPPEERDPKVKAQLQNPEICGPAMLAWAVKGCLEYARHGLAVPEVVNRAVKEYRDDMDPLAEFLEECCVIDSQGQVNNSELWEAYQQWARSSGVRHPLSQKSFSKRLATKEFVPGRSSQSRYWTGLSLKVEIETLVVERSRERIEEFLF